MPCEWDDDECWEDAADGEFDDDWDLPDCDVDDEDCWNVVYYGDDDWEMPDCDDDD